MKKFFITTVIVFGLFIIGIAIFILTFDINRYKPVFIAKLEESMNKDVKIGSISVNLLRGLSLEAKDVAVKERQKTWGDFLLKADMFRVNIEIFPLLKKDIKIKGLSVPELKINVGQGALGPVFKCAVDMKVHILINSLSQDEMIKTLSAKGRIRLSKAVLDNMNILRTALDELSMFPGIVEKLENNLPEKYSTLLNKNYTEFNPIEADFKIKDARIYFEKLLVESDTFYLINSGSIGIMDQSVDIRSDLFMPKDLSAAFINVKPEFAYLADKEGLIMMPLDLKGKAPNISVLPDLDYVLQRLISLRGSELLNKLFKIK